MLSANTFFPTELLPSAFAPLPRAAPSSNTSNNKRPRAPSSKRMEQRRQSARRTRLKKKFELTRLQEQADALKNENETLKRLIRQNLPEHAQEILGDCTTYKQTDYELLETLASTHQPYVLTDPRLPDNPIVYASDRFCEVTGFPKNQVEGRNCRFLQGPATDPQALDQIRTAIDKGVDCTTVLVNYKADGKPFWNNLFIAALRDWNNTIVNYVGVQCEQKKAPNEDDDDEQEDDYYEKELQKIPARSALYLEPIPIGKRPKHHQYSEDDDDMSVEEVDWSMLARALEGTFPQDDQVSLLSSNDGTSSYQSVLGDDRSPTPITSDFSQRNDLMTFPASSNNNSTNQHLTFDPRILRSSPLPSLPVSQEIDSLSECLQWLTVSPLEYVTRTVRSDLIQALLEAQGDVTDQRFDSALTVLSGLYASSNTSNVAYMDVLNCTWRSISRPHYDGCLGTNPQGDFMYTLGKMSFDMFKPGQLVCSVKRTMNHIEKICPMDGAPAAAPWSLRRELAAWSQRTDDEDDESNDDEQSNGERTNRTKPKKTVLKSYNIAVDLTIEPSQEEKGKEKLPPRRLRALNVTQGYMLPDPTTPNRLTVWFTGGRLAPAPPPKGKNLAYRSSESDFGSLEDWHVLFNDTSHRRSWDESFRVMGAKIFCGASLQDEMSPDGTMRYTLHRPAGGHGKAYVDVLYLDDHLLILKSSKGLLHVMVKSAAGSSDGSSKNS